MIFNNIFICILCFSFIKSFDVSVSITGATGILGKSIIKELSNLNCKIYGSYRKQSKATQLLNEYKLITNCNSQLQLFPLDLEDINEETLQLPGFTNCDQTNHRIHINNAGLYLPNNDLYSFKRQLIVNALSPIKLALNLIQNKLNNEKLNKQINLNSNSEQKLTLINISSGDGELCYLNTNLSQNINEINTINEWFLFIQNLILNYNNKYEYSFIESQGYSVSKALLNKATQLLHNLLQNESQKKSQNESQNESQNKSKIHSNIRIISICPNNFQSKMTTNNELLNENMIDVNIVSQNILQIAFNWNYLSGKFYRDCKIISF